MADRMAAQVGGTGDTGRRIRRRHLPSLKLWRRGGYGGQGGEYLEKGPLGVKLET